MTRDELIEGLEAAEQRIISIRPRLESDPERALLTGTWRVRDALSHLAARGNPVAIVLQRLADLEASPPPPPRPHIDVVNAQQVEERKDRTVSQLIDEVHAGHRAAIESMPEADTLARVLTVPAGEESAGDMIARIGARHEGNHLDEILAALGA